MWESLNSFRVEHDLFMTSRRPSSRPDHARLNRADAFHVTRSLLSSSQLRSQPLPTGREQEFDASRVERAALPSTRMSATTRASRE